MKNETNTIQLLDVERTVRAILDSKNAYVTVGNTIQPMDVEKTVEQIINSLNMSQKN